MVKGELDEKMGRAAPSKGSGTSGSMRAVLIPEDVVMNPEQAKEAADKLDAVREREEAQIEAWSAMTDVLIQTLEFNKKSTAVNKALAIGNVLVMLVVVTVQLSALRETRTQHDEMQGKFTKLEEVVLTGVKSSTSTTRAITVQLQSDDEDVKKAVAVEAHAAALEAEAKILRAQLDVAPPSEKPVVKKAADDVEKQAKKVREIADDMPTGGSGF